MSSLRAYVLLDDLGKASGPFSIQEILTHTGHQMAARLKSETNASSFSFVVRPSPPALAVLGSLKDSDTDMLRRLSLQVESRLRRLHYLSYDQVERDCEVLARQLSYHFGPEILGNGKFVGIPRGGAITLGMLSYVLDLSHNQVGGVADPNGPVFVIDDCAITGSRLQRFLRSGTGYVDSDSDREVTFATLYSHPNLRSAIEEESPRVTTCVSARDLYDYGPDEIGDGYSAWQAQWHERHPDERYWIGLTEHLCFPWGEVDAAQWNLGTEEIDQGLSLVPPEHRLKEHPSDEAYRSASDSVQVQPDPAGPIRPTDPVLFGTVDDQTIVANPDVEVCVEFDGTAAAIWHALIEHGAVEDTFKALLDTYSVDPPTLRADLLGFMEQLAANDLLHVPDGALP